MKKRNESIIIMVAAVIIGVIIMLVISNNRFYFGDARPVLIPTGSMQPVISINSVVVVEDVPYEEVEFEDIIRYYNPEIDTWVVHRVIGSKDGKFMTKGDHNSSVDSCLVDSEMYCGRVKSIHNEYAPFITKIIGVYDESNVERSDALLLLRYLICDVVFCLIVFCLIAAPISCIQTIKRKRSGK